MYHNDNKNKPQNLINIPSSHITDLTTGSHVTQLLNNKITDQQLYSQKAHDTYCTYASRTTSVRPA